MACGLGGVDLDLPKERPNGSIKGKVLGGLYTGGAVHVYTLNNKTNRELLAQTDVSSSGDFSLSFPETSQALLVEVSGGSYIEPYNQALLTMPAGKSLTATLQFTSGESHEISVSPFSHLVTALMLRRINNGELHNQAQIEETLSQLEQIYAIDTQSIDFSLEAEPTAGKVKLAGAEKHGLLITALSQVSKTQAETVEDPLKVQFNLISIADLMYEDIFSDGLLDGKSIFTESDEVKTLSYGDLAIDADFYKSVLGLASKESLSYVNLVESVNISDYESHLLTIAQSESPLFGVVDIQKPMPDPQLRYLKSFSLTDSNLLHVNFSVENVIKLEKIESSIAGVKTEYLPEAIFDIKTNSYVLPIDKSIYSEGSYDVNITITDSSGNIIDKNMKFVIDKTSPEILVSSGSITNQNNFLLKGGVIDELSNVKNIQIDDEIVQLDDNSLWEKEVNLVLGSNQFILKSTDGLGNQTELPIEIHYDVNAPIIMVTSGDLTNSQKFLLAGRVLEESESVSEITVGGTRVAIEADNTWFHYVNLISGENAFNLKIRNNDGQESVFVTNVTLDDSLPGLDVTSPIMTNTPQFQLKGNYSLQEGDAESVTITVNGVTAETFSDNTWSFNVTLESGKNDFIIAIEDDAKNYAEQTFKVILDESAPIMSIDSDSVTNLSSFELFGEYVSNGVGVTEIYIDGELANLIDGSQWAKSVTLVEGNNSFNIEIFDEAGNKTDLQTNVLLDETTPQIDISSPKLVKDSVNLLQGTYQETGSGLKELSVNGNKVTDFENNTWSKYVELESGLNKLTILAIDKAGNQIEIAEEFVLDDEKPSIAYINAANAKFSNYDGTAYEKPLELINDEALYIESNQLSLKGMLPSRENLANARMPYYLLEIKDPINNGYGTSYDELKVEYRYFINDDEIVPWQIKTLEQSGSGLILPLVTEVLGNAWYQVNQDDTHRIQVKVTDLAGNTTEEEINFTAQFYSPEISLNIDDSASQFANVSFETRDELVGRELVSVDYSFINPSDLPIKIRVSDDALSSMTHVYNEVKRVHKVERIAKEVWRRASVSNIDASDPLVCPQHTGDDYWILVGELWNYNGIGWEKIVPDAEKVDFIQLEDDSTNTLVKSTDWSDLVPIDGETNFYNIPIADGAVKYNFDYLVNKSPDLIDPIDGMATHISGWVKKDAEGAVVDGSACPDVMAVQKRIEYTYESARDEFGTYPRNVLSTKFTSFSFPNSRLSLYKEDGSELTPNDGWFEILPNEKITIKKYVNTPMVDLHNDISVTNPNEITDYAQHTLDKSLVWNISQRLLLVTQFNPTGLLDESMAVRSQIFEHDHVRYEALRE